MDYKWVYDEALLNWDTLRELFMIAPLGQKEPCKLKTAFYNSRYKCFLYHEKQLIGAGRALADGADCAYICDVAVHPDFQHHHLGTEIVKKLVELCKDHRLILLYTDPAKELFYEQLGFHKMTTAMALFQDQQAMVEENIIEE